jgi:hypothetical protein
MARQYVKVRGVGGGHMSVRKPSAPKIAVRRVSNGKRKA